MKGSIRERDNSGGRAAGHAAGRRRFLALTGASVVALVTGCQGPANGRASVTLAPAPTATPGVLAPTPTVDPFGDGVRITTSDKLFVQSYDQEPGLRSEEWSLTLDGAVDQPLSLTYADLRSLPAEDVMWTLECIGNPVGGELIGNGVWRGARLQPLLARAGIRPEAVEVRFHAADGYSTSVTRERIAHPDTLLAFELNGYPLSREHGFPLRILIPGHYGQKMPKWLTRMECITEPFVGHFESQGWSSAATIRVNSRVERPRSDEQVARGRLVVSGVAHAGLAGIQQVEVGVSDSAGQNTTWLDVELMRGPNVYSWTQWRAFWDAEPGAYLLQAVATDGEGVRQEGSGSPFPDGTSGVHTVVVQVADRSG